MKYKNIFLTATLPLLSLFVVSTPAFAAECGGAKTAIISCPENNEGSSVKDNGIWGLMIIVINILATGVAIVAVGGIIYGASLYASAQDQSDQVAKAKQVITNVVIGLILFALMVSLLNYLIPGGVFNT